MDVSRRLEKLGPSGTLSAMKAVIHHVAHDLDLEGHPDQDRVLNARQTWEVLRRIDGAWKPVWFNTQRKRSSRDLGDVRSVPYVNDLFDTGVEAAGDDGLVCWTNLDVCLVPETAALIRHKLANAPCCRSARINVDDARIRRSWSDLAGEIVAPGTDLFAFRPGWWRKHRDDFPDMFIACEVFDYMLRRLMEHDNPDAEILPPVLYHQRHEPFWLQGMNRTENPAQRNNRQAAVEWCKGRGIRLPF
jgi:hypothetical protein